MFARAAARVSVWLAPVLALCLLGCQQTPVRSAAARPVSPSSPDFFLDHVQPIFQANCYRCHAGLNHRGGLVLDSRAGILKGGHHGPPIVPGHPERSLLVTLIRHEGPPNDPMPMPPKEKLPDADIATIEQWVRAGAAIPSDTGQIEPQGGTQRAKSGTRCTRSGTSNRRGSRLVWRCSAAPRPLLKCIHDQPPAGPVAAFAIFCAQRLITHGRGRCRDRAAAAWRCSCHASLPCTSSAPDCSAHLHGGRYGKSWSGQAAQDRRKGQG